MQSTSSSSYSLRLAIPLLFLLLTPSIATAQFSYELGDFHGPTVSFENVTLGAGGVGGTIRWGDPTFSGTTLSFDPITYQSYAINYTFDFLDIYNSMFLTSVPGNAVDQFVLTRSGIYAVIGPETDAPLLTSNDGFGVTVLEIDGMPIEPLNLTGAQSLTSFYTSSGNPDGLPWTVQLSVDISGQLDDLGILYTTGATRVQLLLGHTLRPQGGAGIQSYYQVNHVEFAAIPAIGEIPEPATFALTAAMLTAIVGRWRLRRRKGRRPGFPM